MGADEKEEPSGVMEEVIEALRHVYDPEIPVNIYDLGLIYKINLTPCETGQDVQIEMTLTTVNCPMADMIPGMVYDKLVQIPDLNKIDIKLIWDPPWDKTKMSEEARLALDMI
jgi:FeS assembly SUF system protein